MYAVRHGALRQDASASLQPLATGLSRPIVNATERDAQPARSSERAVPRVKYPTTTRTGSRFHEFLKFCRVQA